VSPFSIFCVKAPNLKLLMNHDYILLFTVSKLLVWIAAIY
jgi:hypothetical protein